MLQACLIETITADAKRRMKWQGRDAGRRGGTQCDAPQEGALTWNGGQDCDDVQSEQPLSCPWLNPNIVTEVI